MGCTSGYVSYPTVISVPPASQYRASLSLRTRRIRLDVGPCQQYDSFIPGVDHPSRVGLEELKELGVVVYVQYQESYVEFLQ
jgi:hypothetical protein